jgi:hypothetical protein
MAHLTRTAMVNIDQFLETLRVRDGERKTTPPFNSKYWLAPAVTRPCGNIG